MADSRLGKTWKVVAIALLLLLVLGAAYTLVPPIEKIAADITWIRDEAGPEGKAMFFGAYAVGTWLMLPASWLQGAAGFLFGPWLGMLAALVASTGFGTVSFWMSKTLLRGPLTRWFESGESESKLSKLDTAVADGGTLLVILLRLSPLSPYNVVNYSLGLTSLTTAQYVVGTAVGSIVPVVLYTQIGASVSDIALLLAGEAEAPGWAQWGGLGITIVVTIAVTRFAKKALDQAGVTGS